MTAPVMNIGAMRFVLLLSVLASAAWACDGGGKEEDAVAEDGPQEPDGEDGQAEPPGDVDTDEGTDAHPDGEDVTDDDIPLPPDGSGPPCPEPPQAPPGESWPEVFVGPAPGCGDDGPGTRGEPMCTFRAAFDAAPNVPGIVTVLDGEYRLADMAVDGDIGIQLSREGTADAYYIIRADEGASPVLIGSLRLDPPGPWEDAGGGLVRTDASFLMNDPAGMWTAEGRRVIHVMQMLGGVRSHANTADLVDPGTWTKADGAGTGCGADNAGCFVYMKPFGDLDPGATAFEFSQGNFLFCLGCRFLVLEGLTFRFTQPDAVSFEASDSIVVQDNDFGHNANSDDNAYSIFISYSQGVMVRRNKAWDSRYWGGTPNSKGITFMVSGDEEDLWVCYNEIWDIIGQGICTKGGVSNLHAVGNHVHDVGACVDVSSERCHWQGCDGEPDGHTYPGGGWEVRENVFERCGAGVAPLSNLSDAPDDAYFFGSRTYNNLFLDCDRGIEMAIWARDDLVRNNIFMGGGTGIYFNNSAGEERWPDWFISRGLDSDFNIFFAGSAFIARIDWTGSGEHPLSLDEFRASYEGEDHSLETDPLLDPATHAPLPGSPAVEAGDPSVYTAAESVNIGLYPFLGP